MNGLPWKIIERLAATIEVVALYHPAGLRVLLGAHPPLSAVEWSDLLESLRSRPCAERVDASSGIDAFFPALSEGLDLADFIEKAGGWSRIVMAAKAFRATRSKDWNLFVEWVRSATDPLGSRLHPTHIAEVSEEYGVDRKTVSRRARTVPLKIAREAVGGFQEALFS